MKHHQPCSRVFDGEIHEPHTYYWSGRDVKCLGFSPLREATSDAAETPEQFFGLDPITKAPSSSSPLVQVADPEIERLLRKMALEIQQRLSDLERLRAENLAEEKRLDSFIVGGADMDDIPEPDTRAHRVLSWYDHLRPIQQDMIFLVLSAIAVISILINMAI